jgi:hypothetical protein
VRLCPRVVASSRPSDRRLGGADRELSRQLSQLEHARPTSIQLSDARFGESRWCHAESDEQRLSQGRLAQSPLGTDFEIFRNLTYSVAPALH